jgi:hypothetical protein
LLAEWRRLMESVVASAASVGGRAELPRRLLEPMQRQLELVQEVLERRLQKQLAGHLIAPVDATFDLLEENGLILRRQAEALETAGHALQETARLVKRQAELFDRTIGVLREPAERAKVAAGLDRRVRKRGYGPHKAEKSIRTSDRRYLSTGSRSSARVRSSALGWV